MNSVKLQSSFGGVKSKVSKYRKIICLLNQETGWCACKAHSYLCSLLSVCTFGPESFPGHVQLPKLHMTCAAHGIHLLTQIATAAQHKCKKNHEVVFSQCLIPHEHHNQLVFSVPNLLQGPRWRPPAAICRYKHQNHLQGMHMSWWLGWVKHVKHFAAANHKVQPAFHLQCKPNHSHIPNCWCPIALLAPTSILHKSI